MNNTNLTDIYALFSEHRQKLASAIREIKSEGGAQNALVHAVNLEARTMLGKLSGTEIVALNVIGFILPVSPYLINDSSLAINNLMLAGFEG